MTYRISGLAAEAFAELFKADDVALQTANARRVIAADDHGYPCRVSLQDAQAGETLLLLPYLHHAVAGPYRASGPIYVRENAEKTAVFRDVIPPFLHRRLLSVRGYRADDWMHAADVVEGKTLDLVIDAMFSQEAIAYLHIHNARPGCYSCRVDRD